MFIVYPIAKFIHHNNITKIVSQNDKQKPNKNDMKFKI